MATRWWVNDAADNDWNNANNWAAAEGGAGGAGIPGSGDTAYFSDTSSPDNCTLSANSDCSTLLTASADTGGTDDYTAIINISTYDLDVVGAMKIASGCTITIGTSGNTGLTVGSIEWVSGGRRNWAANGDSIINCGGNWIEPNEDISLGGSDRGDVTITGSGNMAKPNSNNTFYNFTQNAGVTTTCTDNVRLTATFSGNNNTINGIFDTNGNFLETYVNQTGTLTIGANADIQGAGEWRIAIRNGGSYSNSRATAFSITGDVESASSNGTIIFPAWNYANANVLINRPSASSFERIISAGTLYCVDLEVNSTAGFTNPVDCDTNNPNFIISGNVDLNTGGGSSSWTKGTGTWKLTGTNQTIDKQGYDTEVMWSSADIGNVTILAADTWDLGTLSLTVSSMTVNGTHKMGATAGIDGFICSSMTFAAGSVRDWQISSKINCSGNWTEPNADISTNNNRGNIIFSGSGNLTKANNNNYFYNFLLENGVTTTCVGSVELTDINSNQTTFLGTMAIAASNNLNIGASATGLITMGASADITGAADSALTIITSTNTTFTNNRVTAFTFPGTVQSSVSTSDRSFPAWDWGNANVSIRVGAGANNTRYITSGTLNCINFTIDTPAGFATIIPNNTNNPNFAISGNWSITGTGTLTYTRGSGIITLDGGAGTQTFEASGATVEDIVINASGATKQMVDAVITDSFIGTAGTIDHNNQNFTTLGNYTISSGFLNTAAGLLGITLTVGGNYSVTGNALTQLDLNVAGAWILNVTGTGGACYADVRNSNASGGSTIYANGCNSSDLGGNLNWSFSIAGVSAISNLGLGVSPGMW